MSRINKKVAEDETNEVGTVSGEGQEHVDNEVIDSIDEENVKAEDMEEGPEENVKAEDDGKTKIKPDISKWAKTDGKAHTDDFVGHALAGLTLDQVKDIAGKLGFEANKYDHLNAGQQRMNLGNRLRSAVKDTGKEGSGHVEAMAAITKHADHHKAANLAAKPKVAVQVDAVEEAA